MDISIITNKVPKTDPENVSTLKGSSSVFVLVGFSVYKWDLFVLWKDLLPPLHFILNLC